MVYSIVHSNIILLFSDDAKVFKSITASIEYCALLQKVKISNHHVYNFECHHDVDTIIFNVPLINKLYLKTNMSLFIK